jgi:hypothetical protein
MANLNAAHGYRFLKRAGGGPEWLLPFSKLAAYGTAIFPGDLVVAPAADATLGPLINSGSDSGVYTPGTTAPTGIAKNFSPASTKADFRTVDALDSSTQILVYVDPYAQFEAQTDSSGFALSQYGQNANTTQDAGDATRKLSGQQVTSIATSASKDWHILGLRSDPQNTYGANAVVELTWNHHRLFPSTAGV